jgi:hypothetical protein
MRLIHQGGVDEWMMMIDTEEGSFVLYTPYIQTHMSARNNNAPGY